MKVQWFSGPPPAVGWWPASTLRLLDAYRWFDGKDWSCVVFRDWDSSIAERGALLVEVEVINQKIKWRHWSIEIDGTDGRGAHE